MNGEYVDETGLVGGVPPSQQKRALQHVAHTARGLAEQATSIASLAPSVRDAIEEIFRLDGVRRVEMEPCCFESLRDFAEPVALRIEIGRAHV